MKFITNKELQIHVSQRNSYITYQQKKNVDFLFIWCLFDFRYVLVSNPSCLYKEILSENPGRKVTDDPL